MNWKWGGHYDRNTAKFLKKPKPVDYTEPGHGLTLKNSGTQTWFENNTKIIAKKGDED